MPEIHPTAVVEKGATIADDAVIGPLCYVQAQAVIGPGTHLLSQVAVLGRTTLGAGNTVWPHAVLGAEPQDLKFRGEDSELIVGDNNKIRECVTMHRGTSNDHGVTRVGSDNLIMVGAHVAHDCVIGNHVIMANNVALAGHVIIEDHALISGASAVHHFVTIGQYAFVGGMTRIVHDVPPYMTVEGNPARVRGVNSIGLERNGFAPGTITHLKDAFQRLWRGSGEGADSSESAILASPAPSASPAPANPTAKTAGGPMALKLQRLESDYPDDPCIQLLIQFIRNSSVGVFGRYRETQRRDPRRRKQEQTP